MPTGFTSIGIILTALISTIFEPTAINKSCTITGIADDGNVFVEIGGTVTELAPSAAAAPTGINASGEIVSYFTDGSGACHGIVNNGRVITTVDGLGMARTSRVRT